VSSSTSLGSTAAIVRRSAAQTTRRAILYVRAPGDPAAPADLARWFTERAFDFYGAVLPLSPTASLSGRRGGRNLSAAFADLDAAYSRLRWGDGMASVIVAAHGRAALAVARWSHDRKAGDALILSAPAWPAGRVHLEIACPILVFGQTQRDARGSAAAMMRRRVHRNVRPPQLGSHVTWLMLADSGASDAGADRLRYLDELGRWLGAYMYGAGRDQLL
jgi:hypothetical protein